MRADRLLKMLMALQSKGKMTTRQLAELVEVSERTILRDMDALTLAGIPVVAERGKSGGWKLMEHFKHGLNEVHFEALKSLFILPSVSILAALNIDASSEEIRQSLLNKLPNAAKQDAQQYFHKIHIDSATWRASAGTAAVVQLRELQAALWEDKRLEITYLNGKGESSQRIVRPLGLVAKGNVWYMVALNENGEYRNYKVSRIASVKVMDTTFTRPEHFNLSQYWEQSKRQFIEALPIVEVQVLAHRSILSRLRYTGKFVSKLEVEPLSIDERSIRSKLDTEEKLVAGADAGSATMVPVNLQFNSEQEAVEFVLGFGGAIQLLSPANLIPSIIEQAKAAIKLYEQGE